jgi:hypothetical protein
MATDEDYGITRCGDREADDPMVWDGGQWQSGLFGGYAHDEPRHPVRVIVRVEQTAMAAPAEAQPERKGPRLINMRTRADVPAGRGVLRFEGHDCRGVLVLTWGALGSKISCHEGGGKLRTIR